MLERLMQTLALCCVLGPAAAGGNLLKNSDFEAASNSDGTVPGWTANAELARQRFWVDAESPHAGRQCLAIRSLEDTEAPSVLSQDVAVEPNRNYSLTLWARRDSFVYGTRFEVRLLKGGDVVGVQSKQFRSTVWRPVTMVFNSGEAEVASVRLTTPNKGTWRITVGRTLWVDDVSLVAIEPAHDIALTGPGGGRLGGQVQVRAPGHYFLWVRVRCGAGNRFRIDACGRSWDFRCYSPGDWYWLRPVLPELILNDGPQQVEVNAVGDGIEMERAVLTMDPFWQPDGAREFLAASEAKEKQLEAGFEPVKRASLALKLRGPTPPGRWGVTQGVPFPKGALGSAANVACRDRPIQASPLMRWPDGSVKWLLVSTLAQGGEALELVYGAQVEPGPAAQPPVHVREDESQVAVDTGKLTFTVPKDGSTLLRDAVCGDRRIESALAVVNGAYSSAGAAPRVAVEERGPVRAVVKIAGEHRNAAGEKLLDYTLRVFAYAGADWLELEHSFLLVDDIVEVDLTEVTLRFRTESERFLLAPGEAPLQGVLSEGPVHLGAGVKGKPAGPCDYPYTVRQGDKTLAAGKEARGRLAAAGPGHLRIAVRNFWQNAPKSATIAADRVELGLVGGALKFGKGMCKTHHIALSFADNDDALAVFERRPLLLAAPEWYCETKALQAWPRPAREGEWPGYEKGVAVTIESWRQRIDRAFRRPEFGGMLHYGDGTYGKGGSNLETALGEGTMLQFLRTGRRDWFDLADIMIRHFSDIDIDHSRSSGGLIWVHSPHRRDRIDPEGAGVNGHSWYNGTVYYGLFSGSRRILDTAAQVGEYYARWPFPLQPYIHYWRTIAWKLMSLMQAYDVTEEVKTLEAALEDVRVTRHQRDHMVHLWPYMFAVGAKGLRHYCEATDDPEARELYLQLLDGFMHLRNRPGDTVNGEWPKAEGMLLGNFPNDRSCAFYNEAAHATLMSGDQRFARAAGGDLNWQITFGVNDPTLLWGSADLVRVMGELGLNEAGTTATLPMVFLPPIGEDGPFSSCDRPTMAFQVVEDRDQPFTVTLFKGSYRKYTHDYRGVARLYGPDGALLGEQAVRTSGLRRYRFDVPADGRTGAYTLIVGIDDPWRWTLDQIGFELAAGKHVLKVRPRYNREVMDAFCLTEAGAYFPGLGGEPPSGAVMLQAEAARVPENYVALSLVGTLGGRALRMTSNGKGESLEIPFEVARPGTYRFFARVWKPYADLLNVAIDDQPEVLCKQTHDMDGNAYPAFSVGTSLGEQAVVPCWRIIKRNFAAYDPSPLRDTPALR